MGGNKDYIGKLKQATQAGFDAGIQSGRQQIMDMMSLVLHDKYGFGKDRLIVVMTGIGEYIDKYQTAWERSDEADYYQKKMDSALAEIYGETLHDSFFERYKFAPTYDYNKGRWK